MHERHQQRAQGQHHCSRPERQGVLELVVGQPGPQRAKQVNQAARRRMNAWGIVRIRWRGVLFCPGYNAAADLRPLAG
jgi:hypothetical protein